MSVLDDLRSPNGTPLIRGATAAQWSSRNYYLQYGELGIELDTGFQKFGVGERWNSTAYLPSNVQHQQQQSAASLAALSDVAIVDPQDKQQLIYFDQTGKWTNALPVQAVGPEILDGGSF